MEKLSEFIPKFPPTNIQMAWLAYFCRINLINELLYQSKWIEVCNTL